jgi:hypothetical protein
MNINQVSEFLSNKTHCVQDYCYNVELLKKILKKAFPKDKVTDTFEYENIGDKYAYNPHDEIGWGNLGSYLDDLKVIKLSEVTDDFVEDIKVLNFDIVNDKDIPDHYDNSKGSIYKFCEDQRLNSWEFDLIKRIVRCRKKGKFTEDLNKSKVLIDLYLKEYESKD